MDFALTKATGGGYLVGQTPQPPPVHLANFTAGSESKIHASKVHESHRKVQHVVSCGSHSECSKLPLTHSLCHCELNLAVLQSDAK